MPAGIFLVVADLLKVEGLTSYSGAWKSYNTVRAAVGKKPGQKITINDYCNAVGVQPDEVLKAFENTGPAKQGRLF
jgi:hypothetical protein